MMPAAPRHLVVAAFAAIYILWGTTYLAIRYSVETIPPLLTIAVRCVLGAAILYGWLALRRGAAHPTRRQWLAAALAGALLFGGQSVLAWAEQRVPSGRAALILTTIPLWLALLEAVRTSRLPSGRVAGGLLVGMAGVALLSGGAGADATLADHVYLVLASLAWAAGSLIARQYLGALPALQATSMQLAGGAVAVIAGSLLFGELAGWSPGEVSPRAAWALGYLVIGGTVIGFAAYSWLLRVSTPHAVGTYAFVNPVVALALAWAVGDERASWTTAAAAVLIVGSVISLRPTHAHRAAAARLERLHDDRLVLASPGRDDASAGSGDPHQLGDRPGRVLLRRTG
jgi:drug/metabolite transporter (DMT)-like permease